MRGSNVLRLHVAAQIVFLLCAHGSLALAGLIPSLAALASLPVAIAFRMALLSVELKPRTQSIVRAGLSVAVLFLVHPIRINTEQELGTWAASTLVTFTCLRLFWMPGPIDDWVLRFLASAQMLTAGFASHSAVYFLALMIFLLAGVVLALSKEALVPAPGRSSPGVMTGVLRATTTLLILILPLSVLFFALLPRTGLMLARSPGRWGPNGVSGFGDSIQLGRTGSLRLSDQAVMRVKSESGHRLDGAYWRGAVLTIYRDSQWYPEVDRPYPISLVGGKAWLVSYLPEHRLGQRLQYQVQVLDNAIDNLFFVGYPELVHIENAAVDRVGENYRAMMLHGAPITYRGWSFEPVRGAEYYAQPLTSSSLRRHLQLPAIDRRVFDLARRWTQGARDQREAASMIEWHLQNDYEYTLEQLQAPVSDPLAHFLLTRKAGHCEYFAAGMAVMLRTMGIPSRVAIGYRGGVFNPLTGYQILRASDAHAWVEAFFPSTGWIRFDPTPAASIPNGWMQEFGGRLSFLGDAFDTQWQDWVVSYDLRRQVGLLMKMNSGRLTGAGAAGEWWSQHWQPIATGLVGGIAAAITLALLLRWRRGPLSEATRMYRQMLRILASKGWKKRASVTPAEFVQQIPEGAVRVEAVRFVRAYHLARFGSEEASLRVMRESLEALRSA